MYKYVLISLLMSAGSLYSGDFRSSEKFIVGKYEPTLRRRGSVLAEAVRMEEQREGLKEVDFGDIDEEEGVWDNEQECKELFEGYRDGKLASVERVQLLARSAEYAAEFRTKGVAGKTIAITACEQGDTLLIQSLLVGRGKLDFCQKDDCSAYDQGIEAYLSKNEVSPTKRAELKRIQQLLQEQ